MKNKNFNQMKLLSVGYIVFIMLLSTSCMMIHNMHNNIDKRDTRSLEDPVCGMQLDKDTALAISYEGSTFYFDSEECLKVFQKSPEQFINKDMKMNNGNGKKRMSDWCHYGCGIYGSYDGCNDFHNGRSALNYFKVNPYCAG